MCVFCFFLGGGSTQCLLKSIVYSYTYILFEWEGVHSAGEQFVRKNVRKNGVIASFDQILQIMYTLPPSYVYGIFLIDIISTYYQQAENGVI